MKVTTAPCASALKVMTQKPSVTMRRGMTFNLSIVNTKVMPIMLAQLDGGDGLTAEENAESIQNALEALPNFAIPSVEVDYDIDDDGGDEAKPSFSVTFTDGHNTGKQKLLSISVSTACDSGAQPKFKSEEDGGDIACTVTRESADNGDYKEQAACSNRGVCDSGTGRCTCFDGYFGLACDHVNTYI